MNSSIEHEHGEYRLYINKVFFGGYYSREDAEKAESHVYEINDVFESAVKRGDTRIETLQAENNTLQAENDALRQRVAELEEYNAKAIKTLESLEAMNIRQHDEIQLGIRVTLYQLRMPKPTTD